MKPMGPSTGRPFRRLRLAPAAGALVLAGALACAAPPVAAPAPSFEHDVQPLFQARCVKCHGANKPKAKLDLRDRAGVLKGGESGPAIVPGVSAKSILLDMVRNGEMPPAKQGKLK